MIMMISKAKKFIMAGLLLTACVSFTGCGIGAKGESEAADIVKNACTIPDSFQKVSYKLDEKGNLAWLDFKAKNPMGVIVPERAYFTFADNKIRMIDTKNIDKSILEEFAKKEPTRFEDYVNSYSQIDKEMTSLQFSKNMLDDNWSRLQVSRKNYFDWYSLERRAAEYNSKLRPVLNEYKQAPEVVKNQFTFLANAKYLKVDLKGDALRWTAHAHWTSNFSELKDDSN